ncbi:MAG: lysozyme inhibitor LprI family protein [Pseudomonadota bacterium]
MKRTILISMTLAIAVSALTGAASARSKSEYRDAFCARTTTMASEFAVCTNRHLTGLDKRLNKVYQDLRARIGKRAWRKIRNRQRQWIKERDGCNASRDCLETLYGDRIGQLEYRLKVAGGAPDQYLSKTRCRGEGMMRSVHGKVKTSIVIRNRATSEEDVIKVYWLDYQGRRKSYGNVYRGDTKRISTYMTHPWVIVSKVPGGGEICHGVYMADSAKRVVTVR